MSAEAKRANHIARAEQSAAAAAEIRRLKQVGKALDVQAQLDAVRGGALTLPETLARGELSNVAMVVWYRNVAALSDYALTAPSVAVRVDAADKAAQRAHDLLKLISEGQSSVAAKGVSEGAARDVPAVLKPEQAEEVLAQRRHFLAKVANEGGR